MLCMLSAASFLHNASSSTLTSMMQIVKHSQCLSSEIARQAACTVAHISDLIPTRAQSQ